MDIVEQLVAQAKECRRSVVLPEGDDPRIIRAARRLQGHYAVSVSANWRVTFRFEDGHAVDVDYLDYH